MPTTAQLLVARDFRVAVRTAAVSALAAMAQQCSAVDQQAEQWMVEGAVRVPVSRAELYVPQGGSDANKRRRNAARSGGALWWDKVDQNPPC